MTDLDDYLPAVGSDAGRREALPAVLFDSDGNPIKTSDGHELMTSSTEQEESGFVAMQFDDISATEYKLLVDVSDSTDWPHEAADFIDITDTYFQIDKESSTNGLVYLGVITAIDATEATIEYFAGVSFQKSADDQIIRDRKASPCQYRLKISDGALTRMLSDFTETTTSINTSAELDSIGDLSAVPAVGDVVVKAQVDSGSYTAAVSIFYHGETEE